MSDYELGLAKFIIDFGSIHERPGREREGALLKIQLSAYVSPVFFLLVVLVRQAFSPDIGPPISIYERSKVRESKAQNP